MRLKRIVATIIVVLIISCSINPISRTKAYTNLVAEYTYDYDDDIGFDQSAYQVMYLGGEDLSLDLMDENRWYEEEEKNSDNDGFEWSEELYYKIACVNKLAKWKSLDTSVATVSKKGIVKAQGVGHTHVLAEYSGKKYYCEITVYKPHLNSTSLSVKKGEKKKIELIGVEAASYKSSNKKVAKVNNSGTITAVKNGQTTITVKGKDEKKYKCIITVTDDIALGGENSLTVVYDDETREVFDLSDKVIIEKNASYILFGQYPQKKLQDNELSKDIVDAKWDSKGNAIVNGIRYKRLSRLDSKWYGDADRKDKCYYEIVASEEPNSNDEKYNCHDNGYIKYWSEHEFAYFKYEPIRWDVLAIEEEKTPRMLVVSHDAIEGLKYHDSLEKYVDCDWEKSSLRSWLNNEFLSYAFTKTEQSIIPSVNLINLDYDDGYFHAEGGKDTKDRIFLLSSEDIVNSQYGYPEYPDDNFLRRCTASDFASAKGVRATYLVEWLSGRDSSGLTLDHKPTYFWLLRSPGRSNESCSCVSDTGRLFHCAIGDLEAIRPAFYINCAVGEGVNLTSKKGFSQIGGKDILTVKYKDGTFENFNLKKDVVKIRDEVEKLYFGSYVQKSASADDAFLTAKWNENNVATIGGKKYKRVPKNDYNSLGKIYITRGNDLDKYWFYSYEPISWIPLAIENDNNKKKLLLVSEMVLDCCDIENYKNNMSERKWETSSSRKYLNSDFYKDAFTKTEAALIIGTEIKGYDGKVTKDKIFLLSHEDVTNPLYGFSDDPLFEDVNRRGGMTSYVEDKKYWTISYSDSSKYGFYTNMWDLRPNGADNLYYVEASGDITQTDYLFLGLLRPSICIGIE